MGDGLLDGAVNLVGNRRRNRNERPDSGDPFFEKGQGRKHPGIETADIPGAASRSQRHQRRLRGLSQKLLPKGLFFLWLRKGFVEEGMAGIGDGNPVLPVKGLFKGKDDEHVVHKATDSSDPSLSPGPELGTYVIVDPHPAGLEGPGQEKVEVGKVDKDGGPDLFPVDGRQKGAVGGNDPREAGGHLEKTHDVETIHGDDDLRPGLGQGRSPGGMADEVGADPFHLGEEKGSVVVTRRLSSDEKQGGRHGDGPLSSASRKRARLSWASRLTSRATSRA